jgi:hypothetical protein
VSAVSGTLVAVKPRYETSAFLLILAKPLNLSKREERLRERTESLRLSKLKELLQVERHEKGLAIFLITFHTLDAGMYVLCSYMYFICEI